MNTNIAGLQNPHDLLSRKRLIHQMLEALITDSQVEARFGVAAYDHQCNVEAMTVFGLPQLQVVDYLNSIGMLVSRIE